MKYFEDLAVGRVTDCAGFSFTRQEIVEFARRYDPQPFHLDDEAAISSLFGRLTASGLHTASAARKAVLQNVLRDTRFLGSPGATLVRMHKPVYPDSAVRVSHTVKAVRPLADWPGVALVEGVALGHDGAGQLLVTIEDFAWIGSRALPESFDASPLFASQAASTPLQTLYQPADAAARPMAWPPDETVYWEDCKEGATFATGELAVTSAELAWFRARFDPDAARGGQRNESHGFCLAMAGTMAAFWGPLANVGGTGLDVVRWPRAVEAGDRLRGELTIIQTRPLRTRPGIGLLRSRVVCCNQLGQVVCSFSTTAFIRMRPEREDARASRGEEAKLPESGS